MGMLAWKSLLGDASSMTGWAIQILARNYNNYQRAGASHQQLISTFRLLMENAEKFCEDPIKRNATQILFRLRIASGHLNEFFEALPGVEQGVRCLQKIYFGRREPKFINASPGKNPGADVDSFS